MTKTQDTDKMAHRAALPGRSFLAFVVATAGLTATATSAHATEGGSEGEGPEPAAKAPDLPIAPSAPVITPAADDAFGITFRAHTLAVAPVLNVDMAESERTAVAGDAVTFLGYSNYPAFIEHGEVRVFPANQSPDAPPLATIPVDTNGVAGWAVPEDAPSALAYVYRVYDDHGRFDETTPQELTVIARDEAASRAKIKLPRPNFGRVDQTARRTIQLDGLMGTVTGHASQATDTVRVSGQVVPVDDNGQFAAQQIVHRAYGGLLVTIDRNGREVKRVSQSFSAPRHDWFVVGQGDLTLGHSSASGPADIVSGDPTAKGSFALGRAAFYAKGIVGNDWKVTASVDTGETLVKDLFSNLDRKDPSQLLRRLNSEQYYPTYGDDSTLVEDAPTQGRFYLRVAKQDSQFVIGNFATSVNGAELAQLDRGLFGALLDYKSPATTKFGERKTQLTMFASDPGTVPGREEFRGTGGSLYFLKRQDVSVGSERVRVELRDRDTGLVLESHDLHAQQDYDFDPIQGRLTLLTPLPSSAGSSNTVRNGSSGGDVPVLVVRYEYTPPVGSLDGYTVGGRATRWLGERVRLGVTAQRDTVEEASQTLLGADAMVRIAAGTYAKAEVARTDGPGFGEAYSVDGGLSFADIANPGRRGAAYAYRAELALDVAELKGRQGDLGKFGAYFEDYDAGFASSGRLTPTATRRWGVHGEVPLDRRGSNIAASYEELTSGSVGSSRTGTVDLKKQFGAIALKAGLRYEDRAAGLLYNSVQSGSRTDAALQVEYTLASHASLYAFGQKTLDHDATRLRNDRIGAGAKLQLSDSFSVSGEVSQGSGGLGADVKLNHRFGEGSEAYVGYQLLADRTDTGLEPTNLLGSGVNSNALTFGARKRFSDALSINGETRLGLSDKQPAFTRSFGLRFEPTPQLSITGTFENGRIDDAVTGPFRRTSGSISVGYVKPGLRLGSAIEARWEKGVGRDQTVWLLRNDASIELSPSWRALGRLNLARASHDNASTRAAEFTEAVLGLAVRPVHNERFNALARLTYFTDLGPVGQVTGSGTTESPKQVSTVASLDVNYDLSRRLTLGAKYGFREGKVSLTRDSDTFVSSRAQLGVIKATYNVVGQWDVLAEGRALRVSRADDTRWGALGAIYRHLGNNVKIGAGYSWSDFSDDLTDQSYSSKGPFLNIIGKF